MSKSEITKLEFYTQKAPTKCGVYKFLNCDKQVIYIGKAKNIQKRLKDYLKGERNRLIGFGLDFVDSVEWIVCSTEIEALILESNLVSKFKPKYNVKLRDDNRFSEIAISLKHKFPRIYLFKGKLKKKDSIYFGPFKSRDEIKRIIRLIRRTKKLRSCSDMVIKSRSRPCIDYEIGLCSAPCVGFVSENGYKKDTQDVVKILNGNISGLQKSLQTKMQECANLMNYEKASELRDSIKALSQIMFAEDSESINKSNYNKKSLICVISDKDLGIFYSTLICDNFAVKSHYSLFYNFKDDGETLMPALFSFIQVNKLGPEVIVFSSLLKEEEIRLLESSLRKEEGSNDINIKLKSINEDRATSIESLCVQNAIESLRLEKEKQASNSEIFDRLKNMLKIPKIERIEVFDNSHTAGTSPIGAMIVAGQSGFLKSEYRFYNIDSKQVKASDDYGMMRYVLSRRAVSISKNTNHAKSPDIWLIDGGVEHRKIACDIVQDYDLDIYVISISKGRDRKSDKIFLKNNNLCEIPKSNPLSVYLQILRDESHRFAISRHRAKRLKKSMLSGLDNIKGIGPISRKKVINCFGSILEATKASKRSMQKLLGEKNGAKIYKILSEYTK